MHIGELTEIVTLGRFALPAADEIARRGGATRALRPVAWKLLSPIQVFRPDNYGEKHESSKRLHPY